MPLPVKCPICQTKKQREGMVQDEKTKRWYCEGECYKTLVKQKLWQEKENREWSELYEYVKNLHNLDVLSTGTIKRLKDLRAGMIFNKETQVLERAWNNGPPFSLQLEAYKLAEESILWCITNKLKGSNNTKATFYCITIMIDHLGDAKANRVRKKREEEERVRRQASYVPSVEVPKFKSKPSPQDISSYLD